MFEDRLLIRRMQQGDPEALRRIYEKYKDQLMTVAVCLLSDPLGAEDCLHDVFVTFAGHIGKFRLNGSLKGYLAICIANRARDVLRSKARQAVPLDLADRAEARTPIPPMELIDREELSLLWAALSALPYEQREVVVMRLQGQPGFRQIAQYLGVPVNTVKSRYRYGLEKLREALNAGDLT